MAKKYEWIGSKMAKTVLGLMALSIAVLGAVFVFYKYGSAPLYKPSVLNPYAVKDKGDDIAPDIAYGQGEWVVVWSSDDDLKGSKKGDLDILVSTSQNGQNWSQPKLLINDPLLSKGNDFTPAITTDGNKNWAVAWSSTVPEIKAYNTTFSIKDDLDLLIARSDDNGKTWKDLKPLNRNAETDSVGYYSGGADKTKAEGDWGPRIATDGKLWVVAWTGNSRVISVAGSGCPVNQTLSRMHFQHTDDITFNASNQWLGPYCQGLADSNLEPGLAADGEGNWVMAWPAYGAGQWGTDFDIVEVHTMPGQSPLPGPVINLSFINNVAAYATSDSAADMSPVVATDDKGAWIMLWSSKVPSVTVDGKTMNIKSDADVLISRSTDKGKTWQDLNVLNSNAINDSGNDTNPQLATNGKGQWVAVWQSDENIGGILGTDLDILIAKSSDNGKTWSSPQALHANADSDKGDDSNPRIATDTMKWVVVWQSDEDGGSGKDSDIVFASFVFP